MSKTDSLHYQLCIEGAKWLHKKKKTQCQLPTNEFVGLR